MAVPTTSVLDSFPQAIAAPVNGDWLEPVSATRYGAGGLQVVGNAVTGQTGEVGSSYWSASTFGADTEVFITVVTFETGNGTNHFLFARMVNILPDDEVDGFALQTRRNDGAGNDELEILRLDNNVETQLGATAGIGEWGDGDKIGFECIGSALKGYRDTGGGWSEIISRTDTTYQTQVGNIGAGLEEANGSMDDFGGGTVVAGGQTIIAGLAAETDSAFGITPLKTYPVGLSTSADSAFGLTANRTRAVGLATETSSAPAVAKLKLQTVGLASEADSALALVPAGQVIFPGLSIETDSAFAITIAKLRALGLASEVDSAFAASAGRALLVGLSTEADSAFAVSILRSLGVELATETDTAFVVTIIGGSASLVRITLLSRKELGILHRTLRGRF